MNRQSPNSTPIDHRIIYTLVVQLTHHIQMLLLKCFFSLIITMAPFFFRPPKSSISCKWLHMAFSTHDRHKLFCIVLPFSKLG